MGYKAIGQPLVRSKRIRRSDEPEPSRLGALRRKTPDVPPTAYQIEQDIRKAKLTTEEKAFICFSYLFATRVTEALRLKVDQVRLEDIGGKRLLKVYNIPNLKTVRAKTKNGIIRTKEEIESMRKGRTISIDTAKDKFFVEGFLDYYTNFTEYARIKPLFAFKRVKAWAIVAKLGDNYWPHLLRHSRLSHLVRDHRFNSYELKGFTGWNQLSSGEFYVTQSGDYIDSIWLRQ